jgi:Flp pilus assembly protein TadB
VEVMAFGIALFIIAILIIYAVFFWMPGRESRKEEKENGKYKNGEEC